MRAGTIGKPTSRLLVTAVVALAAFFVLYGVAVQTEIGQRADEAAIEGGRAAPDRAESAANRLLGLVSIGSLAAAVVVLSAIAWLRRRPRLVLLPAAIVGASLIATELFKLVVFERPLLVPTERLIDNSYPSGHTTVAVSLGLAALLVAPTRIRGQVAVGAALLAGGAGVLVVTADWHRPSDPIGSYALTLAIAAAMVAALHARWPGDRARREEAGPSPALLAGRVEAAALIVAGLLFAGAVLAAALIYGADVDWNRLHAAFLVSVAAILVAAGLTVGALLRALPDPRGGAGSPLRFPRS